MSRCERTERLDQELEASATLFSPPDAGDPPVDEECRMRAGAAQEDPLPLLGDQLIARVAPDDVDVVVREQPYTPRHAVRERVAAQDERAIALDVDLFEIEVVPDVIGQLPSEPVLDLVTSRRAVCREIPTASLELRSARVERAPTRDPAIAANEGHPAPARRSVTQAVARGSEEVTP